MRQLRKRIKRDIFCIVCVQVLLDLCAFFRHPDRSCRYRAQMLCAGDPYDQDLQEFLTNGAGAVIVAADLEQHLFEKVSDKGCRAEAAEDLGTGFFSVLLERDSVDGEYIVFQRASGNRLLGMFKVGRNDDKVSWIDGIGLITKQKIPFSSYDVKQFGKWMCMQYALPVFFIFRHGNGQKLCI